MSFKTSRRSLQGHRRDGARFYDDEAKRRSSGRPIYPNYSDFKGRTQFYSDDGLEFMRLGADPWVPLVNQNDPDQAANQILRGHGYGGSDVATGHASDSWGIGLSTSDALAPLELSVGSHQGMSIKSWTPNERGNYWLSVKIRTSTRGQVKIPQAGDHLMVRSVDDMNVIIKGTVIQSIKEPRRATGLLEVGDIYEWRDQEEEELDEGETTPNSPSAQERKSASNRRHKDHVVNIPRKTYGASFRRNRGILGE
jgi:hypothetical protein